MGDNPAAGVTGETIWMDGEFVPWDEARVHVLTHTLHYGLGVFEGIRCYAGADGAGAVFRLSEHIDRLYASAHINLMDIPIAREEVLEACLETLRRNHLNEGYIRPLVYIGDGAMGLHPDAHRVRAKISTFSRHYVNSKMTNGKTCGDYVNSILAKREALLDGYDEAIMLDTQGQVSEATGENIFVVKNGVVKTPPLPKPGPACRA